MKKLKNEEEIGFLEDIFFKHKKNEDTGIHEREELRWEAIVFIILVSAIIVFWLS